MSAPFRLSSENGLQAPAPVTALRPVDLGHISRYTMGNRSLEREVLQLFADQIWITFESVRRAGSAKEWRQAAHTIKGSALAIGAWGLATTAERAEAMAFGSADSAAAMGALEREITAVTRYIASRF